MNTKFIVTEQSELVVVGGPGVCKGSVFGAEGVAEGGLDVGYPDVAELVEGFVEGDLLVDVGDDTAWILQG